MLANTAAPLALKPYFDRFPLNRYKNDWSQKVFKVGFGNKDDTWSVKTTARGQQYQSRVLYDGLCPICVTEIRFLQLLQRTQPGKVDFIDISLPGYDGAKYKGISYEMAMEEMHVIDEKNMVHRGIPAFSVMYTAVGLRWLGRLIMWPPMKPLMVKSYGIFARNRLKWTGRGEECTTGRCEKKPKLNYFALSCTTTMYHKVHDRNAVKSKH